jgi:NADH oxidase (H2O-forming)
MEDTQILEVSRDVRWIGILDPDLVTFDVVMETKYGTTYNAYYINAEKKTLVETCKEGFWPVYLEKIKQLTDPASIEYIIVDHTEPDHSGALASLLKVAPNATVVGSGNAIRYLTDLMGSEFRYKIVKDGETLSLGNKTLRFIGAPNLHWPDTMYTYLEEDKLLFTCDSFGCHYCHSGVFDDMVGNFDDAFRYYFNVIMRPYSKFVIKALDKIRDLEISAICTGHGPVLRKYWRKYLDLTEKLASENLENPRKKKVLIAYVSAYQNTRRLAEKIAEGLGLADHEIESEVVDVEMTDLHDLENKIIQANAILIGSPIINQNIILQIYQLFSLINPIRDKGKLAGSFGSYGWSGDTFKILESNIQNLKLNYFGEGLYVKFSPHEEDMKRCLEYGKAFGNKLSELKNEVAQ